jgi:glycosyltransferase involved in cell wall biosynthesis
LVWPEPNSSAAGIRMDQVIDGLSLRDYQIHFLCATHPTEFSKQYSNPNIITEQIKLNDSSVDELIEKINPEIVIFDRFMTYEQFGWRVAKHAPQAFTILNMEDIHALRDAREIVYKKGTIWNNDDFKVSKKWIREYTAVHCCDLVWVVSDFEKEFLIDQWKVSQEKIFVLPIHRSGINIQTVPFGGKLAMIGNFLHAPNFDSVQFVLKELWPKIQAKFPEIKLDIYGAYTEHKQHQLPKVPKNVRLMGRAEDAVSTLKEYDCLLAPLNFGAGIKGKILDAWSAGIPVITSAMGAESMTSDVGFGGWVCENVSDYLFALEELKIDKLRDANIEKGQYTLKSKFSKAEFDNKLNSSLNECDKNFLQVRESNLFRMALLHHGARGDEYFSRWIELKEKLS